MSTRTYTTATYTSPMTGTHYGITYLLRGIAVEGTVTTVSVSGENGRIVEVDIDSTKPEYLAGALLPNHDLGFIRPALAFLQHEGDELHAAEVDAANKAAKA